MILFFLSFFLLYGALHLYVFIKLRQAFRLRGMAAAVTIFFLCLMVLAPALVRALEKADYEGLARVLAYGGYTWMACVFFFFILSVSLDFLRLLAYVGFRAFRANKNWWRNWEVFSTRLATVLAALLVCYGWYEANTVRTERIVIESAKIPATIGKIRVVQLSDLHLGLTVGEYKLQRILDVVRKLEPDVLVVTGDILDVQAHRLDGVSRLFHAVAPRWGKYAVTGNHEFYAGIESAVEFAEKAGLRLLRGEAVTMDGVLSIVGIDDYVVQTYHPMRVNRWETELLRKVPPSSFRILLKHKPIVDPAAPGVMELQLSGHTHKGQIFPFTFAARAAYKRYAGLYDLGKGALLYVNRGTGTWGPPIRFLAPPEVTLVEIVAKRR